MPTQCQDHHGKNMNSSMRNVRRGAGLQHLPLISDGRLKVREASGPGISEGAGPRKTDGRTDRVQVLQSLTNLVVSRDCSDQPCDLPSNKLVCTIPKLLSALAEACSEKFHVPAENLLRLLRHQYAKWMVERHRQKANA